MLDIKYIRDHVDEVKKNCTNRGVDVDVDRLIELDEARRTLLQEIEQLRAERNKGSKTKPTDEEIARMKEVGAEIKKLELDIHEMDKAYNDILQAIPNLTHPESPIGDEEHFNEVFVTKHTPIFDFETKTHEALFGDRLDFERGAKVAGSKFYFMKNELVRLNQALIQFSLDVLEKHGFELMETPDMVRGDVLQGSGFNPRGEESQIYDIENHDLHLIGTAEISVLGFHADEVIDLSAGPKKYAALSHCFRTEGGAYGRESKGLYRVHQFSKVEMFVFCKPEESEQLHEQLLDIEQEICDALGLSYRIIDIPTGDLGGPAYRKYDVEAWMTMRGEEGGYGEITSASNCTDYQARRMNIKYKDDNGKTQLVHTLNGTAVVLSRFPVAIAEQFQQEDGTIAIPEVLHPYMGGKTHI